ncbi:MAG: 30S ribosomal protein S3 [Acidobacteria bacterium]|nr:30S ribosomal protein S3 [Acidobacteriota bacterium]
MGQKVHPYGFRLGVTKTWRSRWYSKADYAKLLKEDLDLKEALTERLKAAGLSAIEVDRPGQKLRISIHTSRPGIIIGRKGAEIEKLKSELAKRTGREVFIDIQEVHKPELDAQLVAESIALQLEKRIAFRRAMRKSVDSALRFGCKGIKVRVSGRLNGAEIARSEWYLQGQLPLHTLRADIDYGFAEAHTTYGIIGIKCWTYKGEILEGHGSRQVLRAGEPEPRRAPRRDSRGGDRRGPGGGGGGGRGPGGGYGGGGGDRSYQQREPQQQQPAAGGAPTQSVPPAEMARPAAQPIAAPIAQPTPSWKTEPGEGGGDKN